MSMFSAKAASSTSPQWQILARTILAMLCLFPSLLAVAQADTNASTEIALIATDAANGEPLANAVVVLAGSGSAETDERPAIMAQENHEFIPHVLIVPKGQAVDFPNRDDTRHHVYSFSETKPFNIELYADRPKAPLSFDTPGVVELGCNIHDRMQAFIYVTRFAETGLTDANGQVTITVPTGRAAQLKVWHERLADNTRSLEQTIDPDDPATFTLSLDVSPPPAEGGAFSDLQRRFDNL